MEVVALRWKKTVHLVFKPMNIIIATSIERCKYFIFDEEDSGGSSEDIQLSIGRIHHFTLNHYSHYV